MKTTIYLWLLCCAVGVLLFPGCSRKDEYRTDIEKWDLTRPGFEQAKTLLDKSDIQGAQKSIVEYYEGREGPWPVSSVQIRQETGAPEKVLSAADDLLAYRFTHANETIQLKFPIAWRKNPSTNQEWVWALNRNYEWKVVSRAYVLTGEERYARFISDQIHDWITSNRPPPAMDECSPTWRLIDVGLRMSESWIYTFGLIKDSPHISWQIKWEMLNSICDHARFLKNWSTSQNHLLMESNGLASVAVYFPEFKEAQEWASVAFGRLQTEADRQILPDGVHYECSTHYQWTVADVLENSRHLAKLAGNKAIYEHLTRKLSNMYRFLSFVMRPDGYAPLINDGVQRDIRHLLLKASERYGKMFFRHAATQGAEGKRPLNLSRSFPFGGFTILRSGFVPEAMYFILDHGPLGGYHGHEDFLNFELYAFGAPLIVDPGTYTYNKTDPFRPYFLSSAAHNLILVNGFGQSRRFNMVDPADQEHRQTVFSRKFTTSVDLVTACYNGPFGTDDKIEYERIGHRRIVLFCKPKYFIIIDFISAMGPALFSQLFHLGPTLIETAIDPLSHECFASNGTASLRIIPVEYDTLDGSQILYGHKQPLQGWYSPDYYLLEPAPVIIYERKASPNTAFYNVLAPGSGPGPEDLSVTQLPLSIDGHTVASTRGIALKVSSAGQTDIFIITDMQDGRKTCGKLTTEEHIALFRGHRSDQFEELFHWSLPAEQPLQLQQNTETAPRAAHPQKSKSLPSADKGHQSKNVF